MKRVEHPKTTLISRFLDLSPVCAESMLRRRRLSFTQEDEFDYLSCGDAVRPDGETAAPEEAAAVFGGIGTGNVLNEI